MKTGRLKLISLIIACAVVVIPVKVWAKSVIVTFDAKVVRTIVPTGEKPLVALDSGQILKGEIELSEVEAKIDTSGNAKTFWFGAVKRLTFEGQVAANFVGGNLYTKDDELTLTAVKQYCMNCSAEGPPIETIVSDATTNKKYFPTRYLMVQAAAHKGTGISFAETIDNMVSFSTKNELKTLLFFSEKGSEKEAYKVILTISGMKKSGQ